MLVVMLSHFRLFLSVVFMEILVHNNNKHKHKAAKFLNNTIINFNKLIFSFLKQRQ